MAVSSLQDIKVGSTPLLEFSAEELGLETRLRRIFVKDESENEFGTFKTRKAVNVANSWPEIRKEFDYAAAITSGNYGYALAQALNRLGTKPVLFVSKDLDYEIDRKLDEISILIRLNLERRYLNPLEMGSVAASIRDDLEGKKLQDVTNFNPGSYTAVFEEVDRDLAREGLRPDYVIVPAGGFELMLSAAHHYFHKDTKIIGVTTKNPGSVATMLYSKYKPTQYTLNGIKNGKHKTIDASEQEIIRVYQSLNHKINCEPSAAAAFIGVERFFPKRAESRFAIIERYLKWSTEPPTVVVVNTGNGMGNFCTQ